MTQQTETPSSSSLASKIAQISARLEKVENPFTGSMRHVVADEKEQQTEPWSKAPPRG